VLLPAGRLGGRPLLPLALGARRADLALLVEMVEVLPAARLALQDKGAVREEDRLAQVLDPGFRRFAEEARQGPALGGHSAKVEPRLGAVLGVGEDAGAVRQPAHADAERDAPGVR